MTPAEILPVLAGAPCDARAVMWAGVVLLAVLAHAVVWEAARCSPIR